MDDILRRVAIFQGIDNAERASLQKQLIPECFTKGQVIFHEGEPGEKLYIIEKGKVKLGRKSIDGRENLLFIMGPADMFGELSIFDPGPRTSSAVTITDVKTFTLTQDALHDWIKNQPQIAEQLLKVLARRLRRTNNNLADLIFTDVPGRVAKAVIELAKRFGEKEDDYIRVSHDLTQEELAQLVGASRETVNKALADFASRGWLRTESKAVIVTNYDRLKKRAR